MKLVCNSNFISINRFIAASFGLGLFCISLSGVAQTKQSQLQCKAKAKEASKIAYNDCMILAKENEVENLKKEYKVKVTKLKEFYVKKIKKLMAAQKRKDDKQNAGIIPAENNSSSLPTTLPQKSDSPIANEVDSSKQNFETPAPVNTSMANSMVQESVTSAHSPESYQNDKFENKELPPTTVTTEKSTQVSSPPNSSSQTPSENPTSNYSEPTIQLKEIPSTQDQSLDSLSGKGLNSEEPASTL